MYLRTIVSPYVFSTTVTIVEDEFGDVARLTVCNLEDNIVDPIVLENSIIAVKQPCWTKLVEGGYHIRVDHPSDLIVLSSDDESIPEHWRRSEEIDPSKDATAWKKEGDIMFLKKQFRKALKE
jgi:hypothetical protein